MYPASQLLLATTNQGSHIPHHTTAMPARREQQQTQTQQHQPPQQQQQVSEQDVSVCRYALVQALMRVGCMKRSTAMDKFEQLLGASNGALLTG